MIHEKKLHSKGMRVGPGGLDCPCCGPAPGKSRKFFFRCLKRSQRAQIKRLIQQEIQGCAEQGSNGT